MVLSGCGIVSQTVISADGSLIVVTIPSAHRTSPQNIAGTHRAGDMSPVRRNPYRQWKSRQDNEGWSYICS